MLELLLDLMRLVEAADVVVHHVGGQYVAVHHGVVHHVGVQRVLLILITKAPGPSSPCWGIGPG